MDRAVKVRTNIAVPRNRMEWHGSTSWTSQGRWRAVPANSAKRDSGASRRITVVITPGLQAAPVLHGGSRARCVGGSASLQNYSKKARVCSCQVDDEPHVVYAHDALCIT